MLESPKLIWKSARIALNRAGKDKRARWAVLKWSLLLIYLIASAAYVVFVAVTSDPWAGVFYLFLFGTGSVTAVWMQRWHRKENVLLNYSLIGQNDWGRVGSSDLAPPVRTYLEDRALIIASLLARGLSEFHLHQDHDRDASEVFTRQVLNGFLREQGLWDKLEPGEAELVFAADGRWTSEQESGIVLWSEQLRLLRWVLGLDAGIVPLSHYPAVDFRLPIDLLRSPATMRSKKSNVGPWDIRMQRDIAVDYLARILAELKARGVVPPDPDLDGWADDLRAKSLGDSVDLLAGVHTIADLNEDALSLLGYLASARERYAAYLVEQFDSSESLSFSSWEDRRAAPGAPQSLA